MAAKTTNVLFEGFVTESTSFTTYYYIQLHKGQFLFKMGISKLGAVILPHEDNRLSVWIGSKKDYEQFQEELLIQNEAQCAYGRDEYYQWYYRFKNEAEEELVTPLVKSGDSVVTIFETHFEQKMDMLNYSDGKKVIDSFNLDNKTKYVIHDAQYHWKKKNLFSDKPLKDDEEAMMLLQKHFYGYETSKHEAVRSKYALLMENPALTREMLYVLENERYPEQLTAIDGWVSKDLIECADYAVSEAYFHLMNLKKNPEQESIHLYEMLKHAYPGLYERTELKKDLEILQLYETLMDDKSIEQQRQSLDKGISMKNGKIDPGARPSIAQWLDMANAKSRSTAPSISKEKYQEFLAQYTIPMIQDEIKKYIIGQDELVEHVATYIYYHALRQVRPTLYPRPLLIAGPSGSGKTEAFRVVKNVFKDYFNVEIVDGTTITQEGWKGARKLSVLLGSLSNGYILVIDEFDKLAKPAYDSGNNNVSEHIQAEFLKLLEGEYYTKDLQTDSAKKTRKEVSIDYDTRTLGIVLVGAFESIRSKKENPPARIGFINSTEPIIHETLKELSPDRDRTRQYNLKATKTNSNTSRKPSEAAHDDNKSKTIEITDEDLIAYGVITELVGRISDKCTTNKLTVEQYIQIVKNENSKVSQLMKELEQLGVETDEILNDDLISDLVEKSQTNLLGVRWVSSQIENLLLKRLCNVDIREKFNTKRDTTIKTDESPKNDSDKDSFDAYFF